MTEKFQELPGLWVSVDRVEYSTNAEITPELPHAFVYHITIHNDSTRTVTIKGRKWVISDHAGEKMIIEGGGVVGEFPKLPPGAQFHYNSYHLIKTDSVAEGAYIGQDQNGETIVTRIPRFGMKIP